MHISVFIAAKTSITLISHKGTLRDITYYIAALFCIAEHKLTFVSLNSTLLQLDIVSKCNRYQGMLYPLGPNCVPHCLSCEYTLHNKFYPPSAPPRDGIAFQPQRLLCISLLPILPTKSALKPSSSTWQVSVSLTLRTACQTPFRKHHFFISSCGESSPQWASLHVSAFPLPCPSFGKLRRS